MAFDTNPNDDVSKDIGKTGEVGKKGKKKETGFAKYKWFIIGGGVALLLLMFLAMRPKGGSGNAATDSAGTSNNDPATGYPYGSAADLAALGESGSSNPGAGNSSDGGGSVGATGPTGAAGKSGIESLWALARQILVARGIKNPTNAQISAVRRNIEGLGATRKPTPHKPVQHKPVQHKPVQHKPVQHKPAPKPVKKRPVH